MRLDRAKAAAAKPTSPTDHWFNIRDFGAVGDGARIDTAAINNAVDAAAFDLFRLPSLA